MLMLKREEGKTAAGVRVPPKAGQGPAAVCCYWKKQEDRI